jgi:hypothetical protein
MHVFTLGLIRRAAEVDLPFHVAVKTEQLLSADGGGAKQEVHKFEWFILDALELSSDNRLRGVRACEESAWAADGPPRDSARPPPCRSPPLA